MAITDGLKDLLEMFDANDKAEFERLLEKNDAAAKRMSSSNDLYNAFITGDPEAQARAEAAAKTQAPPPARTQTPAVLTDGPKQVTNADTFNEARLASLLDTKLAEIFGTENFTKKVNTLVEAKANELAPNLYAKAIQNSDELYSVRRSHEREFGTELDSAKFSQFLADNPEQRQVSLTKAHDAFVTEERIQARIAKGIADGKALAETNNVPGASLSRNNPLAPRFMRDVTPADQARGPALDQAAKAFRQLQNSHVQ